MYDVIVIGGGAAGGFAAATAAGYNKKVMLLEKNNRLGKKLAITGKGRCNLTNYSDIQEHIRNCPKNGKFITNALYQFTPKNTMDFFQNLGVELKVERGNRVFPVSDKAEDVVNALRRFIQQNNVEVCYEAAANIAKLKNGFLIQSRSGKKYEAKSLIIATGGKSYPGTGSTGDGYRFAAKMGHSLNLITPSLVPLEVEEAWIKDIMGLSLRNVKIRLLNNSDKVLYQDFGEMLFTHFGVSGPVILSASSHVHDVRGVRLIIDLKPALDDKTLDQRIIREINTNPNKHYINLLKHLLPAKLIPIIVNHTKIDAHKPANSIRKEERKKLVYHLKNFCLHLTRQRPVAEAIITSGGVCVHEINPRTMESLIVDGLYFAGEVIDVDSYTGGFNLQIAFSTGFVAGKSCGKINMDEKF